MHRIITLQELKGWLNIDGESKDAALLNAIDMTSGYIESYLQKNIITKKFVENTRATREKKILLRNFPVYKVESLYIDSDQEFNALTLIDTDEYTIDAGAGIVNLKFYSFDGLNPESVQATYWAGYSRFEVITGTNDKLEIVYNDIAYIATIDAGLYSAEDLVTELQTEINEALGGAFTMTVNYSHLKQLFKFAGSAQFAFKFAGAANNDQSIAQTIGFDCDSDTDESDTIFSDFPVTGVPNFLKMAALKIGEMMFTGSKHGDGTMMLKSEKSGDDTRTYIDGLPADVRQMLDLHRRKYL